MMSLVWWFCNAGVVIAGGGVLYTLQSPYSNSDVLSGSEKLIKKMFPSVLEAWDVALEL